MTLAIQTLTVLLGVAHAGVFQEQWGLENTAQKVCRFNGANCIQGVKGVDIGAKRAWSKSSDCSSVVVAVLDSGVDTRHPDLQRNLLAGKNFVGNTVSSDPSDDNLHGTHVSGIIAGAGNEAKGVMGVCQKAKILPVKVGNADGMLTDADILEGIEFAVKSGAKIVNGSFGGGGVNAIMESAIRRASNTLFVFAAGNGDSFGQGFDIDRKPVYPAGYAAANIIAVAAIDAQDRLSRFSNYGKNKVHLAAPGVNIVSTMPMVATKTMLSAKIPTEVAAIDGTSMATPFVAGAAALVWANQKNASALQIKSRLLASVQKTSALKDKVQSGGRLDLAKALGVK